MLVKFRRFRLSNIIRDTRGAEFVETIILVGLVALAAITAFTMFGSSIINKVQNQATQVDKIGGTH
jgi:pilus assembly protein Flp/PilA